MKNDNCNFDANRNMLTEPGALPGGTDLGAVVGGVAGKGMAAANEPTRERAYRGENFNGRGYVGRGSSFADHGPAYGFGVDARGRYPGCDFDDVESEMSNEWAASRGASILNWEWARHAARDAWNRISLSS